MSARDCRQNPCTCNTCFLFKIIFIFLRFQLTSHYILENPRKRIDFNVKQINLLLPPIGTASGSFWIGGSDMLVEGEWEWMTSHNLVTFTDWASGEPDDFLNQDCLDIKTSAHYHWNDSPCSYLHWFICEKHVYVLQFLILIFVKVKYLKLLKNDFV